jgi:hypothetical protein
VGGEDLLDQGTIANIPLDETVAGVGMQVGKVGRIARIGKLVQINQRVRFGRANRARSSSR